MIIYGSGGDVVDLGQDETRPCSTCGKNQLFHLVLQYRYAHLYYVFGAVSKKDYLLVCRVCSRGARLDKKAIEPLLGKIPIPFMRRYGLLCFVGGIVTIMLTAAFV